MLTIKNLTVQVENKTILQSIDMEFEIGKNYCILGKNGSGKSSLALTLMGHPKYKVTEGDIQIVDHQPNNNETKGKDCGVDDYILFNQKSKNIFEGDYKGVSIKDYKPNERAKKGIFLAFQNIPEIKGVKLFEFLRSIYSETTGENATFIKFKNIILPFLEELGIDKEFLRRDLNVGFSGGEKRKIEILQMRLLKPKYIFLDEVDSGLDIDAFKSVATLLKKENSDLNSFIFITHHFDILDWMNLDKAYILGNGKITTSGGKNIIEKIKKDGFENVL